MDEKLQDLEGEAMTTRERLAIKARKVMAIIEEQSHSREPWTKNIPFPHCIYREYGRNDKPRTNRSWRYS